ncbi:hypothetical protein GCM10011581_31970 [Saccharopolyspora subtropica]|uniref:Uncharacterized protein n=1 Tax=Saccharopolyspora thermophila TaxID=89367 RepID=A0A917NFB4_9PSEU|nr:hypothetical protein [Saccharopolyspora subtropica]GGI92404.1 hypothetical protein GCM10011581_31970 [Saccharopolyspora subtropica]
MTATVDKTKRIPAQQRAGDSASDVIALYQKWYNALTSQLNLDPRRFVLMQPGVALPSTSAELWQYFNVIPPASVVEESPGHMSMSGYNQFLDNYRQVVNALLPQANINLQEVLGDWYSGWMDYKAANPKPANVAWADYFYEWAIGNAPNVAARGRSAFLRLQNDMVVKAQGDAFDASFLTHGVPQFSLTIDAVKSQIRGGQSAAVVFDSDKVQRENAQNWAEMRVQTEALWFFEAARADASWQQLSAKASSAGISVDIKFANVITAPAMPGGWYHSSVLGLAFTHPKDNRVWDSNGEVSWDSTFGETGNMQRFLASVVVVDGIQMTVRTKATFSTEEQQKMRAEFHGGIWPFVGIDAAAGHNGDIKFDDDGSLVVTSAQNVGNPQILGGNIVSAEEMLAR